MSHQSKTSGRMVAAEELRQQALELRKRGYSYAEIGRELGRDKNTVYKAVRTALDRTVEANAESAEEARELEVMRLERWLTKLESGIDAGDPRSIDVATKVHARVSAMKGIDTLIKLEQELQAMPFDKFMQLPTIRELFSVMYRVLGGDAVAAVEAAMTGDTVLLTEGEEVGDG